MFVNFKTSVVMHSSSDHHNHSYVFRKGQETTNMQSEHSSSSDRKKSKGSKDEKYDAVPQKKSRNELQMGKVSLI